MITMTTGARLTRKSAKSSPAAEPMRMFGGSPMRVAVPPMFEAKIWLMRYGNGETFSVRAIDSVTGVSRTTVVTLSRTAESSAVATARITSSRNGSPRERWMASPATYSKKPVLLSPPARIIIPASRKMTLKSIPANASSWSTIPRTTTSRPPSSATRVRSKRSEAIRA